MKKIYLLDTNVIMHDPTSLFAFEDNMVIIPLVVLDELDKHKTGQTQIAAHARVAIRSMDKMRSQGTLSDGVATPGGGILKVDLNHIDCVPDDLDITRPDNRIISVALGTIKENPDKKVIVVTKDINLRVKCDALGVYTEDYNSDSVAANVDMIYSGASDIDISDDEMEDFIEEGFLGMAHAKLYPNEYVLLTADDGRTELGRYFDGAILPVVVPKDVWGIAPRNKEQAFAFDALFNPDIKLVTLMGTSGTGKTLVAAAAAVEQVLGTRTYRKLMMTRPVQAMGKDIGFLPGNKGEKMQPWMAPLQDNLDLLFSGKSSDYLEMQVDAGVIEVEALTYIRGRSIPKSFIIIDEAQQLTRHEVKAIITRLGEGSKVVLTGDVEQIDTPFLSSTDSGLSVLVEKFKDDTISAHVTLTKGERSELATKAAKKL